MGFLLGDKNVLELDKGDTQCYQSTKIQVNCLKNDLFHVT